MLTNEMKRQIFMKLRAENYRASLRLEGLAPPTVLAMPCGGSRSCVPSGSKPTSPPTTAGLIH
ncbi:YhfG family protein [Duganella sp. 1411]|uniref:YhfG family protein n=1 Tax=Duganella sp. 1411 TaxID=2806572 RepID=UPI001AE7D9D4